MAFHETRFPVSLSFGSTGGPERRTDIVTMINGYEERSTPWALSRRRYDAGIGMRSLDDLAEMVAFFEARRGRLHGFRWKDWGDFKSCAPSREPTEVDQEIGTGDAAEVRFQLSKTYRSGQETYTRPIDKPVGSTVLVAIGGDLQDAGADYTLDDTSGWITFATPPAPGAPITAGYEFDVPVRFDTDYIETSVSRFRSGEIPSVPVIEIRV